LRNDKIFENKINFWLLSRYGNLSFEIIEAFASHWETKGVLSTKWISYSDFGSEPKEEITSGWDNLSFNQNIIWDDISIKYFFNKINWYYLATKGLFRFSTNTIQKLPSIGKRFSPEHSLCFKRGDYDEVLLTEFYHTRNIKS